MTLSQFSDPLRSAVLAAIATPDSDIDEVLRHADKIALKAQAGEISNIADYAANTFRNLTRRRQQALREEPVGDAINSLAGESSDSGAAHALVLETQLLAVLSDIDRKVWQLRREGYPHDKIASKLGITALSSRFRLARARKRLIAAWFQTKE